MSELELVRDIKDLIAQGDASKNQAQEFYAAAGQRLMELKKSAGTWKQWEQLVRTKCGIGKSRASELMRISGGKTTVEKVRKSTDKRKKKAASPFRSGENQDAPREPDDNDQTIWRRGLMFRARTAIASAEFEDWSQFKTDRELVHTVRQAAEAWEKLAVYLEEMQRGKSTKAA